jgi:hypothetical protein
MVSSMTARRRSMTAPGSAIAIDTRRRIGQDGDIEPVLDLFVAMTVRGSCERQDASCIRRCPTTRSRERSLLTHRIRAAQWTPPTAMPIDPPMKSTEDGHDHRHRAQPPVRHHDRIPKVGVCLRFSQAIDVALPVAKPQRIDGLSELDNSYRPSSNSICNRLTA